MQFIAMCMQYTEQCLALYNDDIAIAMYMYAVEQMPCAIIMAMSIYPMHVCHAVFLI